MEIICAVILGYLLDLLLADPSWMPHPVVLMGKCITWLERTLRRVFPKTPRGEFLAGLVMAVLLPLGSLGLSWGVLFLLGTIHPALRFLMETFWCYQALAVKGMRDESRNVYETLTGGTLTDAQKVVARIVGRDTERLDRPGVIRAAVETVAESFSDGVAAPMLYLILGGAPLGLCYKAINTMDSMVGYRTERYLYFGRAAARLDDAANFIPSRLAALGLVGAAAVLRYHPGSAFRIWRRDRRNHMSPNSAQTESVMAGALQVQLAGPAWYFGQRYEKPTIGDPVREIEPEDILRANRMLYVGSGLSLVILCLLRLGIVLWTGGL